MFDTLNCLLIIYILLFIISLWNSIIKVCCCFPQANNMHLSGIRNTIKKNNCKTFIFVRTEKQRYSYLTKRFFFANVLFYLSETFLSYLLWHLVELDFSYNYFITIYFFHCVSIIYRLWNTLYSMLICI